MTTNVILYVFVVILSLFMAILCLFWWNSAGEAELSSLSMLFSCDRKEKFNNNKDWVGFDWQTFTIKRLIRSKH